MDDSNGRARRRHLRRLGAVLALDVNVGAAPEHEYRPESA